MKWLSWLRLLVVRCTLIHPSMPVLMKQYGTSPERSHPSSSLWRKRLDEVNHSTYEGWIYVIILRLLIYPDKAFPCPSWCLLLYSYTRQLHVVCSTLVHIVKRQHVVLLTTAILCRWVWCSVQGSMEEWREASTCCYQDPQGKRDNLTIPIVLKAAGTFMCTCVYMYVHVFLSLSLFFFLPRSFPLSHLFSLIHLLSKGMTSSLRPPSWVSSPTLMSLSCMASSQEWTLSWSSWSS